METSTIAERLRELRKKAGLTQEELAEKVGITTATIKKYETNNSNKLNQIKGMRIEFLDIFAEFYDVPTDYILGRIGSASNDVTEQAIYKSFGLDDEALKNLKYLNAFKGERLERTFFGVPPMLFLNTILKSIYSTIIIRHLYEHYISKEKYLKAIEEEEELRETDKYTFRDENRYFAINKIEEFVDYFYEEFIEYKATKEITELLNIKKSPRKPKGNSKN